MIAESSVRDGTTNAKIREFARIGTSSQYPANTGRYLNRKSTVRDMTFPAAMVSLPVQAKKEKFINK
eukprot:4621531-Karenia_brevis.AAC.1